VLPSLRWYVAGRPPTPQERHTALNVTRRTQLMLATVWVVSGVVIVAAHWHNAGAMALLICPAVFFGATAAMCTSMLMTVRTVHPLSAAAGPSQLGRDNAPGVLARLLLMWVLSCALPSVGIALLILIRSRGWLIEKSVSVEVPVLVLSAVAMLWGLRGMILVSRSISDPLREVVDGMASVESGNMDHRVDVYERSEIGRLQSGFNRMVAELQERDRLRDLFGRLVGADVVQQLMDRDKSLYRDVREVAVLFIDLAGSTQLAATRPPEEVADVLNSFFQAVVAAVDKRHGFINKFQGDAVLAVFGAPLRSETAASDALATARELAITMRDLPSVDFGIGVSAGPVFAGYLGAMNRFEYTVIGDPVNEAARLADRAKSSATRLLCSGAAITRAGDEEQRRWSSVGSAVLRGRSEETEISAPVPAN